MSSFRVTTGTLSTQADELEAINGRMKAAVEELSSTELSLKGMWEGEANEAFHAAFSTDKGKMDAFNNLITQYIVKLREIAQRYNAAEQANTQIASNRTY